MSNQEVLVLENIVEFAIRRSALVLVLTGVICVVGFFLVPKLPIDAVPDVTNVQVLVLTEAPGLSAEEMERFVTFPVEMGLNGLPAARRPALRDAQRSECGDGRLQGEHEHLVCAPDGLRALA